MRGRWTAKEFASESRARLLATNLGLSGPLSEAFDFALARWLTEFGVRMAILPVVREGIPGTDTEVDQTLEVTASELRRGAGGDLYVWARLSKAEDAPLGLCIW